MVILIILAVGVLALVVWQMAASQKMKRDQLAADLLDERLQPLNPLITAASIDTSRDIASYERLRVGEVTRHFDTNTTASISGWMSHDMGFHGWGAGIRVGGIGLGTGRLGLSGVSQVNLNSAGVNRDDLTSDGFVAVLDHSQDGLMDTLRVVVPSEQATREMVEGIFEELLGRFTETKSDGTVKGVFPRSYARLRESLSDFVKFRDDASYVSDRLHQVLRFQEESRPTVDVYGPHLTEHSLLGSAIVFSDMPDRILPLFPVALLRSLPDIVEDALGVLQQGAAALPADSQTAASYAAWEEEQARIRELRRQAQAERLQAQRSLSAGASPAGAAGPRCVNCRTAISGTESFCPDCGFALRG